MTTPEEVIDAPFWAGLSEGRLILQKCQRCGYVRWPCAEICPECLSPEASWTALSGLGTIWSYATYHRSFQPEIPHDIPYTVAAVRLEEGPLFVGQVVNPATGCAIGGAVSFETRDVNGESAPAWRIGG
jgi:uncharacterized protein